MASKEQIDKLWDLAERFAAGLNQTQQSEGVEEWRGCDIMEELASLGMRLVDDTEGLAALANLTPD